MEHGQGCCLYILSFCRAGSLVHRGSFYRKCGGGAVDAQHTCTPADNSQPDRYTFFYPHFAKGLWILSSVQSLMTVRTTQRQEPLRLDLRIVRKIQRRYG